MEKNSEPKKIICLLSTIIHGSGSCNQDIRFSEVKSASDKNNNNAYLILTFEEKLQYLLFASQFALKFKIKRQFQYRL